MVGFSETRRWVARHHTLACSRSLPPILCQGFRALAIYPSLNEAAHGPDASFIWGGNRMAGHLDFVRHIWAHDDAPRINAVSAL